MSHLLFAFGDYKENEKPLNLLIELVSQISYKEVKYQYGDAGVIVRFSSKLENQQLSDYLNDNILKLTAMFFVFKENLDMIVSLDENIYSHLFGEDYETPENVSFSDNLSDFESDSGIDIRKIFEILEKNRKVEEKRLTLDELLDKINEVGFNNLTDHEKYLLEIYSKQ